MALNYSFAGKKVLVTGGGQGLGRKIIERLSEDRALLFTIEKDLELVDKLKKDFPSLKAVVGDISDWKSTQEIIRSFGPVDHLINNAAVFMPQPFLEISEESITTIYNVNVKGVISISQQVAKEMIQNEITGTIVNVNSLIDRTAISGVSGYSSSKAALTMLTKSMALELGPYNIRVNSVCPTQFQSPLVDEAPPGAINLITRAVLKGRVQVYTDEVTDSILFLLSPLSSMITGESLIIDGGVSTN